MGVPAVLDFRDVGRLPLSESVPVDAKKERMRFDFLDSVNAQSLFGIGDQLPEYSTRYLIKSAAWLLTLASEGMQKYFRQFCILNHVSLGVYEAKGG